MSVVSFTGTDLVKNPWPLRQSFLLSAPHGFASLVTLERASVFPSAAFVPHLEPRTGKWNDMEHGNASLSPGPYESFGTKAFLFA